MNWNALSERYVPIDYATMAKMNKIRALARKMGARVEVTRYARDAYEGRVVVPLTKSRDIQQDALDTIACFIGELRA